MSERHDRDNFGRPPADSGSKAVPRRDGPHRRPAAPHAIRWLSLHSREPVLEAWLRDKDDIPVDERRSAAAGPNDDCLIYGCPDCAAPLTIRRWLMSADCWQCGTSITVSARRDL